MREPLTIYVQYPRDGERPLVNSRMTLCAKPGHSRCTLKLAPQDLAQEDSFCAAIDQIHAYMQERKLTGTYRSQIRPYRGIYNYSLKFKGVMQRYLNGMIGETITCSGEMLQKGERDIRKVVL